MEVCVKLFTHAGEKPCKVRDGARSGKKRAWGLCLYFLIPLLNVSFKMSQASASSSQIRRIFKQTRSLLYALKVPVIKVRSSESQKCTERITAEGGGERQTRKGRRVSPEEGGTAAEERAWAAAGNFPARRPASLLAFPFVRVFSSVILRSGTSVPR